MRRSLPLLLHALAACEAPPHSPPDPVMLYLGLFQASGGTDVTLEDDSKGEAAVL